MTAQCAHVKIELQQIFQRLMNNEQGVIASDGNLILELLPFGNDRLSLQDMFILRCSVSPWFAEIRTSSGKLVDTFEVIDREFYILPSRFWEFWTKGYMLIVSH